MNDVAAMNDLANAFEPLYRDIEERDTYPKIRPHLAHYTSLEVVESILKSGELWFSNPLYMNDFEEVKHSLKLSVESVKQSHALKEALKSESMFETFALRFELFVDHFEKEYLINAYIFCLSRHEMANDDGILSMWRGYGASGNGAAIVIATERLNSKSQSPLIIDEVQYMTRQERSDWIRNKLIEASEIIARMEVSESSVASIAFHVFERLRVFSFFSKHIGFSEENEWRIIYDPHRDHPAVNYANFYSYSIGRRGVEPKLKLNLIKTEFEMNVSDLIDKIIIGPTVSGEFSAKAFERMLMMLDKPSLASKVRVSGIPFRG
ncbi:DUF2971 domain-containing protein [Xanthobacter sp.]|uniref:DUF2971 domain-containing protein n=1 Tax=Xanthobacter sp. TaxID=35809 RepID=UPI0025CEA530|nr:DUF2971 domain-containing protein [Xanthobacter sp.]